MSISYKYILNPSFFLISLFSFQLFIWFAFFPEQPNVIDGNPRSTNGLAILQFFVMSLALFIGGIFGRSCTLSLSDNYLIISEKHAYKIAKITFYISLFATLFKFSSFIVNPQDFLLILKPHGINKVHSELNDAAPGVATLSLLWVFSSAIFGILKFRESSNLKYVNRYFYCCLLLVFTYSVLNMSRTAFIVVLFTYLSAFLIEKRSNLPLNRVFFYTLLCFSFYWGNALLRTGLVYSDANNIGLFSLEVQLRLLTEFVEKYLAGELNNSFIMMSFETSVSNNFAYATAFSFLSESFKPDYYLNTQNIFGFWYWQFGTIGSVLFVFMMSCMWGYTYSSMLKSSHCKGLISFQHLHFIFIFAGLFNLTRINYYFLHYYLLSITVLCLSVFLFRKKRI